jgi:GTP-binding protein EngB required for normal cell division
MEIYKKVKKNYMNLKNIQFGGSKYSVLSWNLSWEMQTGKSWGKIWCSTKNPNNCQENVANYLKSLNEFDLIAFQEATRTNNFEKKESSSYIEYLANTMYKVKYKSGLESIVSYFNKNKFNLIDYSGYQFKKGRPILAILLEEIITKKKLLFINLHASHLLFYYQLIKLNKFIRDSKFEYNEILIAGDHNTNLLFFNKINH